MAWTTADSEEEPQGDRITIVQDDDSDGAWSPRASVASAGGASTSRHATPSARDHAQRHSEREGKQPVRFAPTEFWRREQAHEAKEKAVQSQRTLELNQERRAEIDRARTEGIAHGLASADHIIAEMKKRLETTARDLAESKAACRRAVAASRKVQREMEAAKRQKTITSFFAKPLQHDARPRTTPEELGEGYTARNIVSKTFSHHVTAIEDRINELSQGDALKQLQLAAAVNQRMQGIRQLRDKDQEAWSYVRNSLKAFFEKLRDRYNGRYPNNVRAAQQAVCAAIVNAAPPRKLHVISEAVGASVDRLSEGRKQWSEWLSGDRESIMDLRGKLRADRIPVEWVEFAIDLWKDSTRRSERAKDSVRNPNDKCAQLTLDMS